MQVAEHLLAHMSDEDPPAAKVVTVPEERVVGEMAGCFSIEEAAFAHNRSAPSATSRRLSVHSVS